MLKQVFYSFFLLATGFDAMAQGYQLFKNPNYVTTTDGGTANWYPSIVTATGVQPYISGLIVRIPELYASGDVAGLDLLLQSPSGTKVILQSDVRSGAAANYYAGIQFASDGLYKPNNDFFGGGYFHTSNYGATTDIFPAPGPGAITQNNPTLVDFFNENPNGTWRLWAVDDTLDGVYTELTQGWELLIQSSATPVCPHPEPPEAVATSDTSIVVTWIGNGTASIWDIFVTPTDTFQFPGTPTHPDLQDDSLALANLTPGRSYGIFVRSQCPDGSNSIWLGPVFINMPFYPCKHTTPIDLCQTVHCDSVPEYFAASVESACGTGAPRWLFRFTPPETGPYYLTLNEFGSRFYWLPDTAATCPTSGWNCLEQVFPALDTVFMDTLAAGMSYFLFVQNDQSTPVFSLSNCPLPAMGFSAGIIFADSVVLSFGNVPALPLTDSLEVYFGPVPLAPPDAGTAPTPGIRIDPETGVATVGGLLPATEYSVYLRKRCDAQRTSCWQGPATFTTLPVCSKVDYFRVDTVTQSWADIAFSWSSILPGNDSWAIRLCLPGQNPDLETVGDLFAGAVNGEDTIATRLRNIPSYQPLQLYLKAYCFSQDPYYQPWQGPFDIPAGLTPPVPIRDIYCGEEQNTYPDGDFNGFLHIANPCYQINAAMGEKIFRYTATKDGQVGIVWNGGYGGNEGSGTGFYVKSASIAPGNQNWTYLGCWKFDWGWDPPKYVLPPFDVQKDSSYYILCDGFDGTAAHVPGNFPFFIGDCVVTCPKVDSITLVGATATTALLRWNNSAPGGYYQVHYQPASGGFFGGGSLTTADTFATLTGLLPSAEYTVLIRSFCSPTNASSLQSATFQLGGHLVSHESVFTRCNPRFVPPGKTETANYDVFEIQAPQNGDYWLYAPYHDTHIYADVFDPANPAMNLIASVTDYGPDGRKDTILALQSGKSYFWVTTGIGGFDVSGFKGLKLQADGPAELLIGPAQWNGRQPGPQGIVPYLGAWWHSGVCADTAGWVHYYKTADDPNNLNGDRLLLSVKTDVPLPQMDALPMVFSSFPGPVLVTSPPAIFFQNPDGIYEMNRIWLMQDLPPAQQIEQDFLVRFYYTQQEYEELKTAIEAKGGKIDSHEDLYFYKINGYHGYSNVSPWEHHIFVPPATAYDAPGYWPYENGPEATPTTWRHGSYGGEHYAETLIHGFSGGGGGATVNGKSVFDAVSKTNAVAQMETLVLAPNPNTGFFSVYLPQAATPGLRLRVVEPSGRLVLEMPAAPGSTRQRVEAGNLPAGLYFLQLVREGQAVAVVKFVKD